MPDHLEMTTPEQIEKMTDHFERTGFERLAESLKPGPMQTEGLRHAAQAQFSAPDPMADIHAAIKFLTWCQQNQKSTKLALEWLTAAALKVAK